MNKNELERLFGDDRLEPSRTFANQLSKKLTKKSRRLAGKKRLVIAAGGAFAIALAASMVLLQPMKKPSLAQTVLLKDLFGKVQAMELPDQKNATFWEIHRTDEGGPQEKLCTNYDRAVQPHFLPRTTMLFSKDTVSALYISPLYEGYPATMFYSEDAEAPAFSPEDVFGGSANSAVANVLLFSKLSDRDGNLLGANTSVPRQATGIYDVYAVYAPDTANKKEYVTGCSKLLLHVKIDAASGVYTEISAYKDTLAESNLVYRYRQIIRSSNMSFGQALPVLQKAGFDLGAAKKAVGSKFSTLVNKKVGYQMEYLRTITGEPTLQEIKNEQGEVTGYMYRFTKLPTMQAGLYAANSAVSPKDEAAFRALAVQKGWTITKQETMPYQFEEGCSNGDTIVQLEAEDTVNKLRYLFVNKSCTQFPVTYARVPLDVQPQYYDPYTEQQIGVSAFPVFVTFTPGTEPPRGL